MESQSTDATLVKSYEYDLGQMPPEGFGFIYCITNKVNGKQYIGQTINSINGRWRNHCRKRGCSAVHNAIAKYGKENFRIETIGMFLEELLNEAEKAGIRDYNTLAPNGYNIKEGGSNGRHSLESRNKMSKSRTGKIFTEEAKRNMAISLTGRPVTAKTREKISRTLKGHNVPDETRNKISNTLKGTMPPNYGKHHSEEAKKKMADASRGKHLSSNAKRKCSIASKRYWMRLAIAEIANAS